MMTRPRTSLRQRIAVAVVLFASKSPLYSAFAILMFTLAGVLQSIEWLLRLVARW